MYKYEVNVELNNGIMESKTVTAIDKSEAIDKVLAMYMVGEVDNVEFVD